MMNTSMSRVLCGGPQKGQVVSQSTFWRSSSATGVQGAVVRRATGTITGMAVAPVASASRSSRHDSQSCTNPSSCPPGTGRCPPNVAAARVRMGRSSRRQRCQRSCT
eukprot:scaffold23105_cov79-Phaeocystis_antarctica.AAC.2